MAQCPCSGTYKKAEGPHGLYYKCSRARCKKTLSVRNHNQLVRSANTVVTTVALPMNQLPAGRTPPNSVVHTTTIENATKMLADSGMVTLQGQKHTDFAGFRELIWFGVPDAQDAPKNQDGSVEFYFDVTKDKFTNFKKEKLFRRKYEHPKIGSEYSTAVLAKSVEGAAAAEHLLNVDYPPVDPREDGWLHPELCIEAPSLTLSVEEVRVVFHRYIDFGFENGHELNPGLSGQYRCVKTNKGGTCTDCVLSSDEWLAQVFAFVNFAATKGVKVKLFNSTQAMDECDQHRTVDDTEKVKLSDGTQAIDECDQHRTVDDIGTQLNSVNLAEESAERLSPPKAYTGTR